MRRDRLASRAACARGEGAFERPHRPGRRPRSARHRRHARPASAREIDRTPGPFGRRSTGEPGGGGRRPRVFRQRRPVRAIRLARGPVPADPSRAVLRPLGDARASLDRDPGPAPAGVAARPPRGRDHDRREGGGRVPPSAADPEHRGGRARRPRGREAIRHRDLEPAHRPDSADAPRSLPGRRPRQPDRLVRRSLPRHARHRPHARQRPRDPARRRHPWEETYAGAISADGRYLGLPIAVGGGRRVALVDLRSDTSRLVAGPRLASTHQALGWDRVRDALYYVTAGGVLARYRVGAPRATALPVRLSGDYTNLAVLR